MANNETISQEKRAAMMAQLHPEEQVRQVQAPPRDLSLIRPEVIKRVDDAQRAAQVAGATMQLFSDAITRSNDPALKKAFENSSLKIILG